jgi:prepilin-type N-terminal cleavage/methylation domain-containing protein
MGSQRRSNHGFTLIELLVVIAIIAVLAAVLFPVFARARDEGRKAHCRSNMHQIIICIRMYLDDHGGYMAPYDPPGDHHNFARAMWMLEPYYRDQGIWFCPSGQRDVPAKAKDYLLIPGHHEWTNPQTGKRYFTNYELGFDLERGNTLGGHNLYEDYGPPSKVQLVMDYPCNYMLFFDLQGRDEFEMNLYRSHKNGCIVGCLDGHIEWWQDEWRYNVFVGRS